MSKVATGNKSVSINATEAIAQPASIGKKMTQYRWVVMVVLALVWIIANADRANLGVALPYMKKEFALSNTEAGLIVSLFSFSYACIQIPTGLFFRKLSTKVTNKLLPIFLFLISLFTGLMGTTSSVFLLKMWRVGLGLSEGPLGIGCTNAINRWFPAKEKGTVTGVFIAGSKMGPVLVPLISVVILEMFDWEHIFFFFAIPGLILAILWKFLVTATPAESRFVNEEEVKYIEQCESVETKEEAKEDAKYALNFGWLDKIIRAKHMAPLSSVKEVCTSWSVLACAISYGCMIGISNTFMAWIPSYLMAVKGFTFLKMGFLASAPFIGSVIGNFIGGFLSDKVLDKRRKPMMMLGAICTIFTTFALVYAPNNTFYLGLMLTVAGILIGIGYAGYTVYPMGLVSKESYPLAFGIVNTGGQLGGALTPLIVGIILDKYSWDSVFIFLAVSSLLCFLLLSTIVEPLVAKNKAC